jgi:(2R)-3-sulfolactate dehydrogenase (NADP+)
MGFEQFIPMAKNEGIACMAVTNSYNCGVVGYHVERISQAGLVSLGFVNAPASIAPHGGKAPVVGTNPITCGVPRRDGPPVIIDQSSSVVAKSEVVVHKQKGEPLPMGWALDKDGQPTTDPVAALDGGTMVPAGGYKGANLALIVEIMAVGMTGATLGIHASSFANNLGGSPRTGQFFIGMNPEKLVGSEFFTKTEALFEAILSQQGTRLPGSGRLAARERIDKEGVTIRKDLYERLLGYCEG